MAMPILQIEDAQILSRSTDVDWWGDPLPEGVAAIAFSASVDGEIMRGRTKLPKTLLYDPDFVEEEYVEFLVGGMINARKTGG